jgi:uncharacterized protein with GYD domain
MPHFLHQIAYSREGWQAIVNDPQDRIEAVRPAVEKLGGRIETAWFAFGDYDVVVITEMPNNLSAAAIAIAFAAGGACKAVQTTPLLSTAEAVEEKSQGFRLPSCKQHVRAGCLRSLQVGRFTLAAPLNLDLNGCKSFFCCAKALDLLHNGRSNRVLCRCNGIELQNRHVTARIGRIVSVVRPRINAVRRFVSF